MDDEPLVLRDLSTSELLTLSRQLDELTSLPGWQALRRAASAQREGQLHLLAFGRADRASAEYARLGGIVAGIDFVLSVPSKMGKLAAEREQAEMRRLAQQQDH